MKKKADIPLKKIAVFRALQLGDMLCSIPALRALKSALPESEITLIGLPWAKTFVQRFPNYFSDFLPFPGYPGLPEQDWQVAEIVAFIQKINKKNFDLMIQLHGNGSIINPMIRLLGAKKYAGYYEAGSFCPDKNFFMHYPEGIPEIERHLALMNFLGFPAQGKYLEFPIATQEENRFKFLSGKYSLEANNYVCIHPGARDVRRWWPAEKFARVADAIAKKGYTIVLTGTETEEVNCRKVAAHMSYRAINLAGKTDLGTLAALIKNAKMIFSNDTGVSHIAAAVKTASVVVFLTSDPARWAPLDQELHRIVFKDQSEDLKYILKKTELVLSGDIRTSRMKKKIVMDQSGKEKYEL